MALIESVQSKIEKRVVDFLKLYDTYFTASNVKIYLQNRITGKIVQVDAATGIGYSYNVSSAPIHVLGARTPLFITRGNGVGQGALTLIFKDAVYMKAMLKYIFNETMEAPSSLETTIDTSEEAETPSRGPTEGVTIAGVYIPPITMTEYEYNVYREKIINNTSLTQQQRDDSLAELLKLKNIFSLNPSPTQISDEQFKVLARKSTVKFESTESTYINANDVIDIGGIHTLFDIRIVLNNSTPYYNNIDTTIVLRDCKIVNEQLDTSSLQDGIIQQSYNFIFKTMSAN